MKYLLLILFTFPTHAAVITYFIPEGPSSPDLSPGQVFYADATIGSTTEKLVGLDYSIAGPVTVISRDVTGSLFSDPLSMNPTFSGVDQGALIDDVSKPLAPGFYHLARYALKLNEDAPLGKQSVNLTGGGWIDGLFMDHALDNNGSFQVNVIPEPVCLGMGVGAIMFLFTQRKVK